MRKELLRIPFEIVFSSAAHLSEADRDRVWRDHNGDYCAARNDHRLAPQWYVLVHQWGISENTLARALSNPVLNWNIDRLLQLTCELIPSHPANCTSLDMCQFLLLFGILRHSDTLALIKHGAGADIMNFIFANDFQVPTLYDSVYDPSVRSSTTAVGCAIRNDNLAALRAIHRHLGPDAFASAIAESSNYFRIVHANPMGAFLDSLGSETTFPEFRWLSQRGLEIQGPSRREFEKQTWNAKLAAVTAFVERVADLFEECVDRPYISAQQAAFQDILNNNFWIHNKDEYEGVQYKFVPHGLANFCHILLLGMMTKKRKRSVQRSHVDIEANLVTASKLFTCLDNCNNCKAEFLDSYKIMMSERLLLGGESIWQEELKMIEKFSIYDNTWWAKKTKTMICESKAAPFELYSVDGVLNCSAQVLTQQIWNLPQICISVQLPPIMESSINALKSKYQLANNTKTLCKTSMLYGTCDVEMKMREQTCNLVVTPLQAVVLMSFKAHDSLTLQEVCEATQMLSEKSISWTKRVLHSLSCRSKKKHNLLTKSPNSKLISWQTDTFDVNTKFSFSECRNPRVPIPPQDRREDSFGTTSCLAHIEEAIISHMKGRRAMTHADIVERIKSKDALWIYLHIRPQAQIIERCIENVIDRGYIKKDENDSSLYRYKLENDQIAAIETAIYKIMVNKKEMKHADLVSCTKLWFHEQQACMGYAENAQRIERCIENLIDRDYIQKDENDSRLYRY